MSSEQKPEEKKKIWLKKMEWIPKDFKRTHSPKEMYDRLYVLIKDDEFIHKFLYDNSKRAQIEGYQPTPRQEEFLTRIAYTFRDALNSTPPKVTENKPFDDGLGELDPNEIPF